MSREKGTYEIFLKNGKPYLRAWHYFDKDYHLDMRIRKANTDKPYCKFLSNYIGLLYLDDKMIAELRQVQSGAYRDENGILTFTPELFAAKVSSK